MLYDARNLTSRLLKFVDGCGKSPRNGLVACQGLQSAAALASYLSSRVITSDPLPTLVGRLDRATAVPKLLPP